MAGYQFMCKCGGSFRSRTELVNHIKASDWVVHHGQVSFEEWLKVRTVRSTAERN